MNTNVIRRILKESMRHQGSKIMKRFSLAATAVFVLAVSNALSPCIASADTLYSAEVLLTDSTGDKIRSDGFGVYTDQVNCVRAYTINHSGGAFMRTGQKVDFCTPPPAQPREVILDFSDPVPGSEPADCTVDDPADPTSIYKLNACGLNSMPDARIIAGYPFYRTNPTTAIVELKFNIARPPTFPNIDVSFTLAFEQPAAVTGAPSNSRTVTTGATSIAELYKNVKNARTGKVTQVSIGRYYMPFQVTYTKLQ